jgi:hypothetical protein
MRNYSITLKGGEMMKYKGIEERIDEALKLAKQDGKNHEFHVCESEGGVTLTKVNDEKCPGAKLGSFQAIPSPADNIQPELQKV